MYSPYETDFDTEFANTFSTIGCIPPYDLADFSFGESIHGDCKLLESENLPALFNSEILDGLFGQNENEKYEIRLHDCMWSGRCKTDMEKNKISAAKVSQHNYHHHHHSLCGAGEDNILNMSPLPQRAVAPQEVTNNIILAAGRMQAKLEDRLAGASKRVRSLDRGETIDSISTVKDVKPSIQNIAPGTSLLINSRFSQQKKQQQQPVINGPLSQQHNKQNIPAISTSDFLRQREQQQHQLLQIRPDSPLSLEDDPPEMKHSVDLSACIVGSNNISLESSFSMNGNSQYDMDKILRIKALREQLEDPSGKIIVPDSKATSQTDILDVLNVLKAEVDDKSDVESDSSDTYHTKSHSPSSGYGSQSPEYNSPHSDHSYTRSKSGVDLSGLGVETPSDSDEEIDVVSVGDKKLPTNPSDKDRRVLQTKVANRITARMVRTSTGLKTIPPVRPITISHANRRNFNYPYDRHDDGTAVIGAPKKIVYNSNSSSGYSSHSNCSSSSSSSSSSGKYPASSSQARKRHSLAASYKDDYSPSSKRSRGKKQRPSTSRRHNSYDQDEADTIEKRNLHNDMERQRRIGLKNLFEALKRQIPSIKDKERAPKVNILREAAKLCEQLTREENQVQALKQQLQIKLQRRQAHLRNLQQQQLQH